MAKIYAMMGRTDLAHEAFARVDTTHEQYSAYRGLMYAREGQRDSAFYWFDRTPTWVIQPMLTLQADRRIDPVRAAILASAPSWPDSAFPLTSRRRRWRRRGRPRQRVS